MTKTHGKSKAYVLRLAKAEMRISSLQVGDSCRCAGKVVRRLNRGFLVVDLRRRRRKTVRNSTQAAVLVA